MKFKRSSFFLVAVAASVMLAGCGTRGAPGEDAAWTPPALVDDGESYPRAGKSFNAWSTS